jgi:hypothetical protein
MSEYNLKLQDGTADANEVVIHLARPAMGQTKYPEPTGGFAWICKNPGALNIPDYLLGEILGVELVDYHLFGASHSMVFYYFGNDKRRYNVFRIFEPLSMGDSWADEGDLEIFPSMGRNLRSGLGAWERLWREWWEF